MQEERIHEIFQASILLKGAHAIVECFGGITLAFLSTGAITDFVDRFAIDELTERHHDQLALHLTHWMEGFSHQSKMFYAFYLLSHGIVKILLVIGLLREKLWAYPSSLGAIGLFILYQLYRFAYTHGIGLILLTIFDLIVLGLVWHEYQLVRRHLPTR